MMFMSATGIIMARRGQWKAVATITGPTDARHVVWALGKFFFFFLRVYNN